MSLYAIPLANVLKTFVSSSGCRLVCLFLIIWGSKHPSLSLGVNSSNGPALVRKVFAFLPFLRLLPSLSADIWFSISPSRPMRP